MAAPVSAPLVPGQNAPPAALFNACFVLFVINAAFFPAAYFAHWWITEPNAQCLSTVFGNVWSAGKLVPARHPRSASDWDAQKQVQAGRMRNAYERLLPSRYPLPFLFVAAFLAQF